jgi:hypothetical protein
MLLCGVAAPSRVELAEFFPSKRSDQQLEGEKPKGIGVGGETLAALKRGRTSGLQNRVQHLLPSGSSQ